MNRLIQVHFAVLTYQSDNSAWSPLYACIIQWLAPPHIIQWPAPHYIIQSHHAGASYRSALYTADPLGGDGSMGRFHSTLQQICTNKMLQQQQYSLFWICLCDSPICVVHYYTISASSPHGHKLPYTFYLFVVIFHSISISTSLPTTPQLGTNRISILFKLSTPSKCVNFDVG